VREPAFDGYGVESLFHFVNLTNRSHLILPLHFCLDHSGCDKDPRSLLPKNLQMPLGGFGCLLRPHINTQIEHQTAPAIASG